MKKLFICLILFCGLMFWVTIAHATTTITITSSTSDNGTAISWTAVSGATKYQITLDGTLLTPPAGTSYNCLKTTCSDGNHTVSVVALDASGKQIGGGSSTFTVGTGTTGGGSVNLKDIQLPQSKFSDLSGLLQGGVDWFMGIMGAIAVMAIVYSGIMYITAAGDVAKAETARKNLTWAIMGLVIAILAIVAVNGIVKLTG